MDGGHDVDGALDADAADDGDEMTMGGYISVSLHDARGWTWTDGGMARKTKIIS